jgi:hypothetical protein
MAAAIRWQSAAARVAAPEPPGPPLPTRKGPCAEAVMA